MEPRLFSRGNVSIADRLGIQQAASMEPRLFSRGNPAQWRGLRLDQNQASMEPRLFSRGNDFPQMYISAAVSASMEPRLFSRGNG